MSGDLKWNKIFGAGLATVFVILAVREVSGMIYATEAPEKMGYFIDAPEEATGGEDVELPPDWGTVLLTADTGAGERAFARCAACHTVNQGGADGIGPNLYGIVGSAVANNAGFAYSDALTAHAGQAPTWTYDELDQFITAPARYIPGTKMSFAGLRNTEERVALIAYLREQGSSGYPVPAPDPSRQPGAAAAESAEGDVEPAVGTPDPALGGQTPEEGIGDQPAMEESLEGGELQPN